MSSFDAACARMHFPGFFPFEMISEFERADLAQQDGFAWFDKNWRQWRSQMVFHSLVSSGRYEWLGFRSWLQERAEGGDLVAKDAVEQFKFFPKVRAASLFSSSTHNPAVSAMNLLGVTELMGSPRMGYDVDDGDSKHLLQAGGESCLRSKPPFLFSELELFGNRVVLLGLLKQAALNGLQGDVLSDNGAGRWGVRLESGKTVSVNRKNLILAVEGGHEGDYMNVKKRSLHAIAILASDEASSCEAHSACCLHGGPAPANRATFFSAMTVYMDALAHLTAYFRGISGLSDAEKERGWSFERMAFLCYFWSRPDMAASISADSYKTSIGCAVECVMEGDYTTARIFLHLALFLEQWAKQGGAALVWYLTGGCVCKEPWATESVQTLTWLEDCSNIAQATFTDCGLTSYLAGQTPCNCLRSSSEWLQKRHEGRARGRRPRAHEGVEDGRSPPEQSTWVGSMTHRAEQEMTSNNDADADGKKAGQQRSAHYFQTHCSPETMMESSRACELPSDAQTSFAVLSASDTHQLRKEQSTPNSSSESDANVAAKIAHLNKELTAQRKALRQRAYTSLATVTDSQTQTDVDRAPSVGHERVSDKSKKQRAKANKQKDRAEKLTHTQKEKGRQVDREVARLASFVKRKQNPEHPRAEIPEIGATEVHACPGYSRSPSTNSEASPPLPQTPLSRGEMRALTLQMNLWNGLLTRRKL